MKSEFRRGVRRRGTPETAGEKSFLDQPSNLIAQIPFEDWRKFQVKLLLDGRTMQDWILEHVMALVAKDFTEVEPMPYTRVPRTGRTHTIIARVDGKVKRALNLRLSLMGIPYSAWIHSKIKDYIQDIDLDRLKETVEAWEAKRAKVSAGQKEETSISTDSEG